MHNKIAIVTGGATMIGEGVVSALVAEGCKVVIADIDTTKGPQVEARHAVVLALGGAIPDFTLAPDAQGVFQGVVCLALVQPDLSPALHVGVE